MRKKNRSSVDLGANFANVVELRLHFTRLVSNKPTSAWTRKEDFLLLEYYNTQDNKKLASIKHNPRELWSSLPEFIKPTKTSEQCVQRLEKLVAMV